MNRTERKLLRECRDALQESIENEGRLASFAALIKRINALLSATRLHTGRGNALVAEREAASKEGVAVIRAAMRWYRQGRSEMLAQDDMALDRACAPLAAKRKERK